MSIIKVTQEDINEGAPSAGCNCPVSRAFKRAFGGLWVVSSYFVVGPDGLSYKLSRSVQRFIKRFDSIEPVKPFNFKFNYEAFLIRRVY